MKQFGFIFVTLFFTYSLSAQNNSSLNQRRDAINFNPNISVIIDGLYYSYSSDEPVSHVFEEMQGFAGAHDHGDGEEHEHSHSHGFSDGFNLRHLELMLDAAVDPYFKGWAIVAVDEDGAELEEAVVLTTALPYGLQIKLGKFFSDCSRINAQHAHQYNFVEAPLIYELLLGSHGLNEKGIQFSWLSPLSFHLKVGFELLEGANEKAFVYHGEGYLPEENSPRLGVLWLKTAPNMPDYHAVEFSSFIAKGVHQEEHLGETGEDDIKSHFLSGYNTLYGLDFVYKYTPPKSYGQGTLTLEGGYLYKEKDVELVAHNNPAASGIIGNSLIEEQDGLYLQAIYGFLPRWRFGIRGEIVGLTNTITNPDGSKFDYNDSNRYSAMIDWTLTEFSRIRIQYNTGNYETAEGSEKVNEVFVQANFSLGAHGAHKF